MLSEAPFLDVFVSGQEKRSDWSSSEEAMLRCSPADGSVASDVIMFKSVSLKHSCLFISVLKLCVFCVNSGVA